MSKYNSNKDTQTKINSRPALRKKDLSSTSVTATTTSEVDQTQLQFLKSKSGSTRHLNPQKNSSNYNYNFNSNRNRNLPGHLNKINIDLNKNQNRALNLNNKQSNIKDHSTNTPFTNSEIINKHNNKINQTNAKPTIYNERTKKNSKPFKATQIIHSDLQNTDASNSDP